VAKNMKDASNTPPPPPHPNAGMYLTKICFLGKCVLKIDRGEKAHWWRDGKDTYIHSLKDDAKYYYTSD